MAGALSFVGGFFNGLNNVQAQEAEKRARDQERFGALALNSINEYKREISRVRREHQELNAMGKQLIAAGVEPEKVDYALSLPYQEAVKFMANPEALRNVEVRPRQPAPGQSQAPAVQGQAAAPPAVAPGGPVAAPAQGAAPAAPTAQPTAPMAAASAAPTAPMAGPAQAAAPQTFGMREGTVDPLADMRNSIMALAQNAGWSPKMMQQFQQAAQGGRDLGVYRFANPETAGQLIFRDPKQFERVAKANDHAMTTVLQVASRLAPDMSPEERVRILDRTFQDAYRGVSGGTMDGAIAPAPDMFRNLLDPTFARTQLERKQIESERKAKIDAFTAEYVRQGMKPEDARVRATATAQGMTQTEQRQGPDPNPGFNQIYGIVGSQFKGDIVPDPLTGQIRVNITDQMLRAEALFATTIAQEVYRGSLERSASGRIAATTPAQAAQFGMAILGASRTMLNNAIAANPQDKRAAVQMLQTTLQAEMNKPTPDQNRIYALQGAITLASVQEEQAVAPPSSNRPTPPPAPRFTPTRPEVRSEPSPGGSGWQPGTSRITVPVPETGTP